MRSTPTCVPEAAVTQTAGLIYERGKVNRFRVSVDYVDTVTLGRGESISTRSRSWTWRAFFPSGSSARPSAPGDPQGVGLITSVLTGNFNLAWRHSENWNASLDYAWTECLGGTLEAYCRMIYFQSYGLEVLPDFAARRRAATLPTARRRASCASA